MMDAAGRCVWLVDINVFYYYLFVLRYVQIKLLLKILKQPKDN